MFTVLLFGIKTCYGLPLLRPNRVVEEDREIEIAVDVGVE
jgi:hypothetical protein